MSAPKLAPNKVTLVAEEPTAVLSVDFGEGKLKYPKIVVPKETANAILALVVLYVPPQLRFVQL